MPHKELVDRELTADGSASSPAPVSPEGFGGVAGREGGAVWLAAAGWVGADLALPWLGTPVVAVAAVIVTAAAMAARSWPWLGVGVFLLLSHVGASAAASYQPVSAQLFDGPVSVVDDPEPVGVGWAVVVRLPTGDRVESVGYGLAGWDLAELSIGQTHQMRGWLRPPPERDWLRVRHITGRLSVQRVDPIKDAGMRWLIPEALRNLVIDGASPMSDEQRALYLGLVIGDDRFQPLGQRLRFRASGLTHLLAVSGQNVAFVLSVLGGPLRLLGRRSRFTVTVAALLVFAVMTRLEPSVLRATASALLAVWASATGRERSGLIVLSVAILVLLLFDPFLVDSIGFQLSVAASAGILVLQPIFQRRIPGPAWFGRPLSTTIAAQLGVSPILGFYFGPVSLASIPANLLAGWAAGAVMTLGLSLGLAAGAMPSAVAGMLHLPTVALLGWIESVATWHAGLPAPRLGPVSALGLSALALAMLPSGRAARPSIDTRARRSVAQRLFLVVPGLLVVLLLGAAVPRAPTTIGPCGRGITWYPAADGAGSALVVSAGAFAGSVEACMDAGIGSVDVVVSTDGGRRASELVTAIREVMDVSIVLAPPQHRIIGARRQLSPVVIHTGSIELAVEPTPDGRSLAVVEQVSW